MVVAHQPPSPPAIVRAWSRALDANDNETAGKLFAPGARVIQPGVDVRVSPTLAVEFNASLPCGGKIVRLTRQGNRVTAVFLLVHRPKHTCDAPGQKAAAVFTISKRGLIVRWQQIPVPAPKKPTA
jgi:hypothetical protein